MNPTHIISSDPETTDRAILESLPHALRNIRYTQLSPNDYEKAIKTMKHVTLPYLTKEEKDLRDRANRSGPPITWTGWDNIS